MDIILASTSPYRRALLQRLQLPFSCVAPPVDEARLPGEAPAAMAGRLALAKAESVARLHPEALVIGSDQVAALGDRVLGKPGAPRLGNAEDWAPRLEKGIAALHDSGINGVPGTGMMAKGGCMNCSDEEVIASVDYMVESVQ